MRNKSVNKINFIPPKNTNGNSKYECKIRLETQIRNLQQQGKMISKTLDHDRTKRKRN